MMHILLLHQIFVSPHEGGGTRHYELGKYLAARGHAVTIIASDTNYLTGEKRPVKRAQADGMTIIYVPTFHGIHAGFISRALSFVSFAVSSFIAALRVRNVDLVWGSSPPLFQSVTARWCAALKGKPFVFEVRDLWVDFARDLGILKHPPLIALLKGIERYLYRSAALIIVNSPGFIPYITPFCGPDRITLIPNGVVTADFEVTAHKKEAIDAALPVNAGDCVAVYLGNLGTANDLETVLAAAGQLKAYPRIRFILMGGGMLSGRFEEEIRSRQLSNVSLLPPRAKKEIPLVLARADIGIATLKNIRLFSTTYPNKVFDYMAAGKPTVVAIDGVIREVIEKSNGGTFVPPGDADALAKAVLKYYNEPELGTLHGRNARTYVKEHFERQIIAEKLENHFLALFREDHP